MPVDINGFSVPLALEQARRSHLFLDVEILIEHGASTRRIEHGRGLIVNEVGNVSLERGVTSLSQSAKLGGCFTSLVLSSLQPSLVLRSFGNPHQLHPFENFRRRDDSSPRSIIPVAGYGRTFQIVSFASSTSVGVDVPRRHIIRNDKQLDFMKNDSRMTYVLVMDIFFRHWNIFLLFFFFFWYKRMKGTCLMFFFTSWQLMIDSYITFIYSHFFFSDDNDLHLYYICLNFFYEERINQNFNKLHE